MIWLLWSSSGLKNILRKRDIPKIWFIVFSRYLVHWLLEHEVTNQITCSEIILKKKQIFRKMSLLSSYLMATKNESWKCITNISKKHKLRISFDYCYLVWDKFKTLIQGPMNTFFQRRKTWSRAKVEFSKWKCYPPDFRFEVP